MSNWIIPCSPGIYDAEGAFQEYGTVVWHQECNVRAGDTVYIYVTSPVKEIRFKCAAEEVDIPFDTGEDEGYAIDEEFCARARRRYMSLKLVEVYNNPLLSYQALLYNGLGGPVRSQRRVPPALQRYIDEVTAGRSPADG